MYSNFRKRPTSSVRSNYDNMTTPHQIAVELAKYRRKALMVARQLNYDNYILERIENAETETQIQNALKDGRNKL